MKITKLVLLLLCAVTIITSCSKDKSNFSDENNQGELVMVPSSMPVKYACSTDDTRSDKKQCCETYITQCYPNNPLYHHFSGCWNWTFEATDILLVYRAYVNNVQTNTAAFHLFPDEDQLKGCNFYDINIALQNGSFYGYACRQPSFNRNCPAKIRFETFWAYKINGVKYECGHNTKTINYLGNPDLCPSKN